MGTEDEGPEPDCQKQFQAAVSVIQSLPKNGSYHPSYEEMLRFYSYYKQATVGPCLVPRPGFWDPIGRYKWDAWNSLGKMSREEAMSAYIAEMKVVAQKVIDTVPLGEVAEDMFGYFEPLYQVIPDMPRPPETFLKRVTGRKEQILNGDVGVDSEPPCPPKEPVPPSPGPPLLSITPLPSPEAPPPRELDSEVFCDSLEQLEPELRAWGAVSWDPRIWTRGWWEPFRRCRRACGMSREGCRTWRACPAPTSRCPHPMPGPGPSGSRAPRCSSSSCGPSLSSGSSDSFAPRRGDSRWRDLCSQLRRPGSPPSCSALPGAFPEFPGLSKSPPSASALRPPPLLGAPPSHLQCSAGCWVSNDMGGRGWDSWVSAQPT
ncbi:acyl-CoA-binding domain-containing protein 4 isoform X2 [Tenrec ecaudatus]|uniref:acyl-CoA-binding domain-containing protein 4 isoform X2 n=1 Tax=Tenrec ecaudatus TaxID=94439 RepID=UPI003F599683